MLKYLSKFVLQMLPTISATVIGAYIVATWINPKAPPEQAKIAARSPQQAAKAAPTPVQPAQEAAAADPAEAKPVESAADAKPAKPSLPKPSLPKPSRLRRPRPPSPQRLPARLTRSASFRSSSSRRRRPKPPWPRLRQRLRRSRLRVPKSGRMPTNWPVRPSSACGAARRRPARRMSRRSRSRLKPERNRSALRPSRLSRRLPPPSHHRCRRPCRSLHRALPPGENPDQAAYPERMTPPAEIPTARNPLNLQANHRVAENPSFADDVLSATKSFFRAITPQ